MVDVEIVCSDSDEHRRRVESRVADITAHRLPTWNEVQGRDYRAWDGQPIVIDTAARPVEQCVHALWSALNTGGASQE